MMGGDEVTVKIEDEDAKKKIKKMEEELEKVINERDDMKSKLTTIAEQKFQEKRKAAGAPETIDTVEKLVGFVAGKEKAPTEGISAGQIPLSRQGDPEDQPQSTEELIKSGKSVENMGFDSYNQMVEVLNAKAKKGDVAAKEALTKLLKKGRKVSAEVELDWKSTSDVVSGKEKAEVKDVKEGGE